MSNEPTAPLGALTDEARRAIKVRKERISGLGNDESAVYARSALWLDYGDALLASDTANVTALAEARRELGMAEGLVEGLRHDLYEMQLRVERAEAALALLTQDHAANCDTNTRAHMECSCGLDEKRDAALSLVAAAPTKEATRGE